MAGTRGSSSSELNPQAPAGSVRRKKLRRRSLRVTSGAAEERAAAAQRVQELDSWLERPKSRADCVDGLRPCPYVGCRYHLYLDVSPGTGTIRLSFPELEVWELTQTCALDLADGGPSSAEAVSVSMNVSRERVRQIELSALSKLERQPHVRGLSQP